MKRLLTILMFSSVFYQAKAQGITDQSLCFSDAFGYVYNFPSVQRSGNTFSATGTSSAYPSSTATLRGVFTSSSSGNMKMDVVNNNPDGCTNYSDSYTYTGTFAVSGSGGTGSGSWNSYCSGSVINSGTWSASGPCTGPRPAITAGSGPATAKRVISSIRVQPNPAVSQAQIFYTVTGTQQVSIVIYNSMQQPVATLVNETKTAGSYSVNWNLLSSNGTAVTNGIYTAVVKIGTETYTKQIQVLK